MCNNEIPFFYCPEFAVYIDLHLTLYCTYSNIAHFLYLVGHKTFLLFSHLATIFLHSILSCSTYAHMHTCTHSNTNTDVHTLTHIYTYNIYMLHATLSNLDTQAYSLWRLQSNHQIIVVQKLANHTLNYVFKWMYLLVLFNLMNE